MNQTTKKRGVLFGGLAMVYGGLAIMAISIISGAIYRIFTTPLDTSANDIGAGPGMLIIHPIIYGVKGGIEGAIVGGVLFLVILIIWGLIAYSAYRKKPTAPPTINGGDPM